LQYFVTILFLVTLKGSVHTPGEVNSFNTHCLALTTAAATKFNGILRTILELYHKNMWFTFLWLQCRYSPRNYQSIVSGEFSVVQMF